MLMLPGLPLLKRSILWRIGSSSGLNLDVMCAHHWIGFTLTVNSDIMRWNIAGGEVKVRRWQNGGREKACTHLQVVLHGHLAHSQSKSGQRLNGICAHAPKKFMLTAHLNTQWPRGMHVTERGPFSRWGEAWMGVRDLKMAPKTFRKYKNSSIQNSLGKIWNKRPENWITLASIAAIWC